MKMGKNIFSELEGNNWAKGARGNVASQALSACLAESQFKRCAAQQTLRFWATVLLGGHLFEIHWIRRRCRGNRSSEEGGGRDKKSATTFFKPGRYKSCTLNSEINAKWRCCLG
jgi:hypothetical protein